MILLTYPLISFSVLILFLIILIINFILFYFNSRSFFFFFLCGEFVIILKILKLKDGKGRD